MTRTDITDRWFYVYCASYATLFVPGIHTDYILVQQNELIIMVRVTSVSSRAQVSNMRPEGTLPLLD